MSKLLFTLGIILFGLALGYLIQVLCARDRIRLPWPLESCRKGLQKTALLFLNPIAIVGSVWIVDIRDVKLAALPLLGFFALLIGGILALGVAKMMRPEPRKTGALFPCGSFTNIGSIGALICFVFLGERGFALVPVYKLFEETSYYAVGFPIAKYYSLGAAQDERLTARFKGLIKDPFILVAVSSLFFGTCLNLSGISRPDVYGGVNTVIIPLATILLLTSIGLAMRFSRVRLYIRECLSIAAIKFIAVPILVSTAAYFIGFGAIEGGLPLKVVIILSSMPVAFNALIPPSIYDLDLDLANACWFFTTASLIWVLPILFLIIHSWPS
jgi:predicted permease